MPDIETYLGVIEVKRETLDERYAAQAVADQARLDALHVWKAYETPENEAAYEAALCMYRSLTKEPLDAGMFIFGREFPFKPLFRESLVAPNIQTDPKSVPMISAFLLPTYYDLRRNYEKLFPNDGQLTDYEYQRKKKIRIDQAGSFDRLKMLPATLFYVFFLGDSNNFFLPFETFLATNLIAAQIAFPLADKIRGRFSSKQPKN